MKTLPKLFLSTIILFAFDAIYISSIKNTFFKMIENIQKTPLKLNIFGFLMSYVFVVCAYYFVITKNFTYIEASILGTTIYGIYDMTNLATIKNWSLLFSVIDIIWGGLLFGLTRFIVM